MERKGADYVEGGNSNCRRLSFHYAIFLRVNI